jgi:uncharacterized protein YkwD
MQLPLRHRAALVAVALLASAGTRNATASADDGAAPDASRARTIAVAGCRGSRVYLSADEKATLELHNTHRIMSGLPSFCVDAKLTAAARAHSDDMMARSYFSHSSPDGTAFGARVTGFGYAPVRILAENIAWGTESLGSAEHTFQNWLNSAGHRANIQNALLREIGIGVSTGTFQRLPGARVYTVDFGTH